MNKFHFCHHCLRLGDTWRYEISLQDPSSVEIFSSWEEKFFISPRPRNFDIFITILAKSSQYNKYSISSGVCLSLTSPQRPSLCQYAVAAKAKTDVKVEFGQKVFIMTWGHLEANSFSATSSFRLSDVLGLFPSPLAFSSFCFALRVTIVGSFKHTTSVNVKL